MESTQVPTAGQSLSNTAYRTLRDRILSCELSPGERLTERPTAAELGLGLSPVRAALTRLVDDGLVQVSPRKGYRVTPLTVKSVNDLFNAWMLLGPEIARLGVDRAQPEQLTALRRLMADIDRALATPYVRGAAARFCELGAEMFDLLAVATGNERLVETYQALEGEMGRIWTVILSADPHPLRAANIGWYSAVDRRESDRAAHSARAFIAASQSAAMRVLQSWPSVRNSEVVPLRSRTG